MHDHLALLLARSLLIEDGPNERDSTIIKRVLSEVGFSLLLLSLKANGGRFLEVELVVRGEGDRSDDNELTSTQGRR